MNTTVRGPEPDLVGWTKEQERNTNQSSGLGLGQHLPASVRVPGMETRGPRLRTAPVLDFPSFLRQTLSLTSGLLHMLLPPLGRLFPLTKLALHLQASAGLLVDSSHDVHTCHALCQVVGTQSTSVWPRSIKD